MADKDLKRGPHYFKHRDDVWWYEEPKGIYIVVKQQFKTTTDIEIPWRSLRAALRRKDA